MAKMPAQQGQRKDGEDASMILATMPVQEGGIKERDKAKVAKFQLGVLGGLGRRQRCTFSTKVIFYEHLME